ncbi:MAG TPA: terminase gpA endonuclease subunit [Humisphaera sp.]
MPSPLPSPAGPMSPPAAEALLSDAERSALEPPAELNPAEWAERYRELGGRQRTSRPGPWRNANQPCLVGIMVLAAHRAVRTMWIMKAAQVGGSEAVRNVLACVADQDPSPFLLVLPNEKKGREDVRKKIIPLFEDTPRLARHLSTRKLDNKLSAITLTNGFELTVGYAGSTTSIAGDPQKRVFLDEVDKFENLSQQADPVYEALVRLRTYLGVGQGLLIGNSTPSTPDGPVAKGYEGCAIQLAYHAPCPHCGAAFAPAFGHLRWEKFPEVATAKARADRIRSRGAAWLECPACNGRLAAGAAYPERLRITERHKRAMLNAGYWAPADGSWRIYADGRVAGEKPEGDSVGFHVHAIVDLSSPLADVAAEFVAADGDRAKLKAFHNLTLGLPFAEAVAAVTADAFRRKCVPDPESGFVPPPARKVPRWASKLLLTLDTQKGYWWFVLRAWGADMRSQRVHHGRLHSWAAVEDLYYNAWWPNEDPSFPPMRAYGSAPLGIDSGGGYDRTQDADASLTEAVYQWCLKDPTWRIPLKGASKPFESKFRWSVVEYTPKGQQGGQPFKVRLAMLDPVYWRDLLAGQVAAQADRVDPATGEVTGRADVWGLNDENDDEYNRHLSAVHKVRRRTGRYQYAPKPGAGRHDYHDVESYQQAFAAHVANCFALPTEQQIERMLAAARARKPGGPAAGGKPAGLTTPDGRPFSVLHRKP